MAMSPWVKRLSDAFANPVERLGDVLPQLLSNADPSEIGASGTETASSENVAPQPSAKFDDEGQGAGQYYLPGLGPTYLDPQFAHRVSSFIANAQKRGVGVGFASGYRNQDVQDALQDDPTATTPATNSLHSAGRAIDIHIPRLANGQID